jgi:flagellar hook-basal body complex protein FliE
MDPLQISPIEIGRSLGVPGGVGGASPILPPGGVGGAAGAAPVTVPFQDILKQAVETANSLSIKSVAMNTALVQGKPVDLLRVVLAQQEAQISFDLVMQMRDKLVSAYQEILRMPL